MEIRAFCHDDLADVCGLINSELGYEVSCEDLKTRILKMQEDKNYMIFVAIKHNKVIGFIGLQICLAFEMTGNVMRIIGLAVSSDVQGQGTGSALIQKAEEYAKAHYASMIAVNSGLKRKEAHGFYEKQAFYKKGYSFCKEIK